MFLARKSRRFFFYSFDKMFLNSFNISINVIVVVVALSTFVSVGCVPIAGGESVPDDGEL